ncbi:MAG: hypothetical protein AAF740_07515 [Bacteroidota bacterium]
MKKVIFAFLSGCFILVNSSIAQNNTSETSPWEKRIGITGAVGEGGGSFTAGFSHLYGFGDAQRFRLGYGVRFTSFFGSDNEFSAAPPDLASEENPQIFAPASSQLNALNLGIYTDYAISEKLLAGFNIDLIGLSFGAEQEGLVTRSVDIGDTPVGDNGQPTSFNLLLVGDNDIGTLNSEFWIGYKVSSKVMIRGVFSYLFTEYTTNGQYQDNNDRFRYKASQGAIGVNYVF